MGKIALITGVTGQDGSYLSEFLVEKKEYDKVIGIIRRTSNRSFDHLKHVKNNPKFQIIETDLLDSGSINRIFKENEIDECYNLAAMSFVKYSFDNPVATFQINFFGCANLLDAIRNYRPNCKFYQASTSEMYGSNLETRNTENTNFMPRSPYGTSKLAAHWHTVNMREAYGLFASTGLLHNHESPRRGIEFVTQKIITNAVKQKIAIDAGKDFELLELGNLDSRRDWGDARDYIRVIWMILQHDKPDDFVLSTGRTVSVRDFVEATYNHPMINMPIHWEGLGKSTIGIEKNNLSLDGPRPKTLIGINPEFYRPVEITTLTGDYSKAKKLLGWEPKYSLEDLIDSMIVSAFEREKHDNSI